MLSLVHIHKYAHIYDNRPPNPNSWPTHLCRGKDLQHLLAATKRVFSLFYILKLRLSPEIPPLKSTEIWRYRKQSFGVLKFTRGTKFINVLHEINVELTFENFFDQQNALSFAFSSENFSKSSSQLNLLYRTTIELSFENLHKYQRDALSVVVSLKSFSKFGSLLHILEKMTKELTFEKYYFRCLPREFSKRRLVTKCTT